MSVAKKSTSIIVAGLIACGSIMVANPSFALENHNAAITSVDNGRIVKINDSSFVIKLGKDAKFDENNLTVTRGGVTEKLPTEAVDIYKQPVNLEYKKVAGGIKVNVVLMYQDRDGWECAGGTLLGGLAGFGYGAAEGMAYGTVFLPGGGTISGGLFGGILGAVSGAFIGAEESCDD